MNRTRKIDHHSANRRPFVFNPYEIALYGRQQAGKTDFVVRLIDEFSAEYKIGMVKHNEESVPTDSMFGYKVSVSTTGSKTVALCHPNFQLSFRFNLQNDLVPPSELTACDMVFVEGYKGADIPKIVLLDDRKLILNEIKTGDLQNVIAAVGEKKEIPALPAEIRYFQPNDRPDLKLFLLEYFERQVKTVPLYGLILGGGKSSRMQTDKSLIRYFQKPQTEHVYDLLSRFCQRVFVSNRREQARAHDGLPQIHDIYLNFGPLGGILSAMTTHPEAAWLVLACDLPFMNEETLDCLTKKRNPFKFATAFYTAERNFLEPLGTIYEPKCFARFLQFVGMGYYCPRKMLLNSDIQKLRPPDAKAFININDPEEFEKALKELKSRC